MRILVVDDEPGIRRAVAAEMEDAGYDVVTAASGSEAVLKFREAPVDLVITDLKMDGIDGLQVLQEIKRQRPETEVMMMTAHGSMETAVEAMRAGAYDYISKPFDLDDMSLSVSRMAEKVTLSAENTRLRHDLKSKYSFDNIIGASGAMQDAFKLVERVAPRDATVLLRGESGTGKEVFARLIHNQSPRANGAFMAVNCAALPENLLESELFGHEKGAFTGAIASRAGLFREADGGTLFLDEIGEVTTNIQVKLLRAIQEREVLPLGGRGPVPLDVRIIAATNQDLELGISEGWFREDLYYRLAVFPIRMPTLRQRRDDIEPLAAHFLKKGGYEGMRFAPEAMHRMMAYEWPGNVRQLENIVERSALMADGDVIEAGDLPSHVAGGAGLAGEGQSGGGSALFVLPDDGIHLESLEEDLIRQAIRKADGNKTRAAQLLGITRRTLYSRLDKMGWTANS
jgi:two-component system NtrC family response regulator